jgi:hypothetical protein
VATYSVAEKITKVIQASTRPLNQLFLPKALKIATLANRPSPAVLSQLLRITWPQMATVMSILAAFAIGYATIGGDLLRTHHVANADQIASLVILMSVVSLLGVANFMLGWAGLSVLNARRYLLGAYVTTGTVTLALCVALASFYGARGAAVCFVLGEALLLYFVVRRFIR